MIDLGNGWKIDTYSGGYVAANKFTTKVDSKTGRESLQPQNAAYLSTLSNALNYVFMERVREKIGGHRKDIDLEKVVRDVKEVFAEFEALLAPLKKLEKVKFDAEE